MVYFCESWDYPTHTSKDHFLAYCLYERSYGNSSLCGSGICMSTLVPCDRTNLNPLDAAMCIHGTENWSISSREHYQFKDQNMQSLLRSFGITQNIHSLLPSFGITQNIHSLMLSFFPWTTSQWSRLPKSLVDSECVEYVDAIKHGLKDLSSPP